jgi:hypothetical protein
MTSLYMTLYILLFMAVVLLAAIGSRAGGFLRSSKMRRPQISSLMTGHNPKDTVTLTGKPDWDPEDDVKEMDAHIDALAASMDEARAEVSDMFTSPEILSTILTILVDRYGDIRLSPDDFVISDLDYVSIYVDNDSQEMILSMDRNLAEDDLITGIVIPDENTYH